MITLPFTVITENRERAPYLFENVDFIIKGKPERVLVETKVSHLDTGDYSIENYEDKITVERKGKEDLIQTLTRGRDRFEREMGRMSKMESSYIVIESNWEEVMRYCSLYTMCNPVSIDNSIIAFMNRFKTHWVFRPDRYTAQKTVLKIFDRFWRDKTQGNK